MLKKYVLTLSVAVVLATTATVAEATSYGIDRLDSWGGSWGTQAIDPQARTWPLWHHSWPSISSVWHEEQDPGLAEYWLTRVLPGDLGGYAQPGYVHEHHDYCGHSDYSGHSGDGGNWGDYDRWAHDAGHDWKGDASLPEPSAALAFGVGSLIVGAASRRRQRS